MAAMEPGGTWLDTIWTSELSSTGTRRSTVHSTGGPRRTSSGARGGIPGFLRRVREQVPAHE
eukprot:2128878-Heterocapsa_arctica.AAC.1